MKKIGIACRYENSNNSLFIKREYIQYVNQYFDVVALTIDTNINDQLNQCDCFLIPGGDDVNPYFFGEEIDSHSEYVIEEIDLLDKKIIEYAVSTKKPILGICRGIQVINVFLGGTLLQNIEDNSHKKIEYGDIFNPSNKGNILTKIYSEPFLINSYHHQCIKDLASDLIVSGYSNGIIEAVEHKSLPIIAVQWHPEKLKDQMSEKLIKLFRELVYESR